MVIIEAGGSCICLTCGHFGRIPAVLVRPCYGVERTTLAGEITRSRRRAEGGGLAA